MDERVDAPAHPGAGPGLTPGNEQVMQKTFQGRVLPEAGGKRHGGGRLLGRVRGKIGVFFGAKTGKPRNFFFPNARLKPIPAYL